MFILSLKARGYKLDDMKVSKGYYLKILCVSWIKKLWWKVATCKKCRKKQQNKKLEFMKKYYKEYNKSSKITKKGYKTWKNHEIDRAVIYTCN